MKKSCSSTLTPKHESISISVGCSSDVISLIPVHFTQGLIFTKNGAWFCKCSADYCPQICLQTGFGHCVLSVMKLEDNDQSQPWEQCICPVNSQLYITYPSWNANFKPTFKPDDTDLPDKMTANYFIFILFGNTFSLDFFDENYQIKVLKHWNTAQNTASVQ